MLNDDVRRPLLDEGFKRAGALQTMCHISLTYALRENHLNILSCEDTTICSYQTSVNSHTLMHTGARGHDLFLDFVGKAFNAAEAFPDLTVHFEDETVYAHKFLLAVRAPAIGEASTPSSLKINCSCFSLLHGVIMHVPIYLSVIAHLLIALSLRQNQAT